MPKLNKVGAFFFGVVRAVFVCSIFSFLLVISSTRYFRDSLKKSLLGKEAFKVFPATYTFLWNTLGSKFAGSDKINDTIREVQEIF